MTKNFSNIRIQMGNLSSHINKGRMVTLIFACLVIVGTLKTRAQRLPDNHEVQARIIAIGAGGAATDQHTADAVIKAAAQKVIDGKTTVIFLGDNLPPRGMDGEAEVETTKALESKYLAFTQKGVPVYFTPGEKDWDNGGPEGLGRVVRSYKFIQELGNPLVRQVPVGGCPDPELITISDNLVVIFMDSQWWLHPYDKVQVGADCDCGNVKDVAASLRELLYQNRYKTIILATHHPFKDYGRYNGHKSWKDHLFPLTAIQKDLYLPLPVVGTLFTGIAGAFPSAQQLAHPLYKQMRQMVGQVFQDYPNLIHLSAHEPGLQLISDTAKGILQVISAGVTAKGSAVGGSSSAFHSDQPGFVLLDQLASGETQISIETLPNLSEDQGGELAFQYDFKPRSYHAVEHKVEQSISGDSALASAHPVYNEVSGMHRLLFGRNYRKAWAQPVKLPVLRISELYGGLHPIKLGGGFQSTSLRLADKKGNEYTLRSVEKSADLITPEPFQGTFLKDWLDDATSSQHPYSALVVPPLAEAVGVLHTSPVIGVVAPDTALGAYQPLFAGKVTLLEQREPAGRTDNTLKTMEKLQEDNDNDLDSYALLRARGLDYLIADWDRHEDQWRFHEANKKGKPKYYQAVPRDRDMALTTTEGLFPILAKEVVRLPKVFGFNSKDPLRGSNFYFYKSGFLEAHPRSQIGFENWHQAATQQQAALTDEVLEGALRKMPPEVLAFQHERLLSSLKQRRDHLTAAMDKYYALSNRYVDIHSSDKHELVEIKDVPGQNALEISMRKISKKGNIQDTLMHKIYPRQATKEIRLYLGKGDDSVYIDNKSATVKLRLIGGKGHKSYQVAAARKRIKVYDHQHEKYTGAAAGRLKLSVASDSAHTAFVPTSRYNLFIPLLTAGYNADDKLTLGLGGRLTLQHGFRKQPYSSVHQFLIGHSFSTNAFKIHYTGQWHALIGKADLVTEVNVNAPNNTQNYFGRGNQTVLDKFEGYQRYYRTRFTTVNLAPALKWNFDKGASFKVGPGFEYYHMDASENKGRFIEQSAMIGTYDSMSLLEDKYHVGLNAVYELDHRDNQILPQWGLHAKVELRAYKGLNELSRTFAQLLPELSVYKPLDSRRTLILSDRLGGGVSLGHTAFYQSFFLGGQGNLQGYRNYRFAGDHGLYNNLALRWSLMDFGNYIVKGELGLSGFFDIGRVWQENESSSKWHNGLGGGLYFAPAGLGVFKFDMGYSSEGWYPYFSMGLRF